MSASPLPPRSESEMSKISGLEDLMKTEYFSQNLARLTPDLKAVVLEALDELFQQETFATIDMIQECRAELQGEARIYDQDVEVLRAQSRMLAEERETRKARRSKSRSNSRTSTRSDSRISESRLSYVGEQASSGLPLSEYIAKRRSGDLPPPGGSPILSRASPSLTRVSTSMPSLSTVSEQKLQKESEKILSTLSQADARREEQRERQQERLEQQRQERRRAQQVRLGKAVELLEKALAIDKIMERDKVNHGQKIQSRLEEMKKRREGRSASEMDRMTPTLPNVAEEQENADPHACMETY